MAKPILGIMYDFDKTLSTTDMQNYSFIPMVGMTPEEFWGATGEFSEKSGCERILSYMYMMIAKAKEKGIKLTREVLRECGKSIKYHPGVSTWFSRINEYGKQKGVKVEHYLVSSGTKEILEGCSIYDCFTNVYGCEFYYVNPTDRDHFIALDDYFSFLHAKRVNELIKIAQDLGAKHFRITYLEEKRSLTSNNAKAAGKGLLKGLGKAKADAETNQSEKNYSKEELAAEMSFAGHDPVTPKLEYLQNDPTVRNLIEMRMSQNAMTKQKIMIKCINSSGIKEKDAMKIDAALKDMNCNGSITLMSEVQNEARRVFEYEIEF